MLQVTNPLPISDSDMQLAVASGAAAPLQPTAISDDQFTPDDPQLANRRATDKITKEITNYNALQNKYGGAGNELLAGMAGAGRGATLGLSDLALTKSGLVNPSTLQGLQEANPLSSGAGQIAGGAGLIGLTGGAGALTEGAGIGAKIAGAAAEGGTFGVGNAVSDYAMGDPTLNAQKIAAHIGTGALFGAGLGALGETIKSILPKATEALSNTLNKTKDLAVGTEETPGIMQNTAPNWAEKFNNGLKYGREGTDGTKIKVRDLISNLSDLHGSSKKAASALYEEAAPANIGAALQDMSAETAKTMAANTVESMKNIVGGIGDTTPEATTALSSPTSLKIVNTALEDLEYDINKAKSAYEVQNSLSNFAKDIDSRKIIKFDTLPTAANQADQSVLMNLRNAVRGDLKNPELWGDAATHYSKLSEDYSAYKNSLKNFQSSFMKGETGASGAKRYVVDPTKVNSFFNRFDNVSQDLKKQYLNDFINQTDNLSKASENYHGFVKGAESISDHVSNLAKQNEDLAQVAQAMSSNGKARTGLDSNSILALGAHAIGVPNPVIGAGIGMAKAYQAISNPYQLGASLGNTFSKLKAVGDILQKATGSIDSGAKSIFSGNSARSISSGMVGLTEKLYNKHADRIDELYNNPVELMNHLDKTTSAMYEAAPNISTGLHSTITNGIQFLKSKMPQPANELPLNSPWKPTPSQMSKFNKYFQAVNHPIKVLSQIKDGSLSNEAMEALQAVHPELLQEMREKVMSNMQPRKLSSLNYSTKIALSKFIGQPLESAMQPQVIMANQAAMAMPSRNESRQPKAPKSSSSGLQKLAGASRESTRTQDLMKDNKV